MQGTDKLLDFRPSNRTLPTLRLDIDDVETELVFFYDAINPPLSPEKGCAHLCGRLAGRQGSNQSSRGDICRHSRKSTILEVAL